MCFLGTLPILAARQPGAFGQEGGDVIYLHLCRWVHRGGRETRGTSPVDVIIVFRGQHPILTAEGPQLPASSLSPVYGTINKLLMTEPSMRPTDYRKPCNGTGKSGGKYEVISVNSAGEKEGRPVIWATAPQTVTCMNHLSLSLDCRV